MLAVLADGGRRANRRVGADDGRLLAERARGDGVYASIEVYRAETHVFHLFWSFLAEAADALEAAGAFAREIHQGAKYERDLAEADRDEIGN